MDTQTIQHYEDTIAGLRQELSQSPNSRQARRERIMCALLANPDEAIINMEYEDLIEYSEGLLDASDAIDAKLEP